MSLLTMKNYEMEFIQNSVRVPIISSLQADIHIAKFNVTGIHPTHDVLLTRDEAPLGFVVV